MSRNLLSMIGVILVAAAVLTFGATNASAELILNGSFETSDLEPGDFPYSDGCRAKIDPGDTANLPDWLLVAGSPDLTKYYYYGADTGSIPLTDAHEGDRFLFVCDPWTSGTDPSANQSFAVTAGTQYDVSFWEKLWRGSGKVNADITLDAGSATGTTTVTTGSDADWTEYAFSFTPDTNATATLTFTAAVSAANDSFLDSVSVTAIPEPGTLALLATGLLGLLCYAWRKRR